MASRYSPNVCVALHNHSFSIYTNRKSYITAQTSQIPSQPSQASCQHCSLQAAIIPLGADSHEPTDHEKHVRGACLQANLSTIPDFFPDEYDDITLAKNTQLHEKKNLFL